MPLTDVNGEITTLLTGQRPSTATPGHRGRRQKPPSIDAEIDSMLSDAMTKELPPSPPSWGERAGRFVTEGLPAAGRAARDVLAPPTWGMRQIEKGLAHEPVLGGPPRALGFLERVTRDPTSPLPYAAALGENLTRLPRAIGAAAAELGPEMAKPLTEAIASQVPFLPWGSLFRRVPRGAPAGPAAAAVTAPRAMRALPSAPIPMGDRPVRFGEGRPALPPSPDLGADVLEADYTVGPRRVVPQRALEGAPVRPALPGRRVGDRLPLQGPRLGERPGRYALPGDVPIGPEGEGGARVIGRRPPVPGEAPDAPTEPTPPSPPPSETPRRPTPAAPRDAETPAETPRVGEPSAAVRIEWRQTRPGAGVLDAYRSADGRFRVEQLGPDSWVVTDTQRRTTRRTETFHDARQWATDQAPPVAARFERTELGDQVLIPGTPQRAIPTTRTVREGQRPTEDTPLFGQERAARERAQSEAQGDIFGGPQSAASARAEVRGSADAVGVNTRDPESVAGYVRAEGGIRGSEYENLPLFLRNKTGRTIDELAANIADAQGRNPKDVEHELARTLQRYRLEKGTASASAARYESPPTPGAYGRSETVIDVPPADVEGAVSRDYWRTLTPDARRGLLDELRDITFGDESGRLDLQKMVDAWKRVRQKFPMEAAVRGVVPDSPAVSEIERYQTSLADRLAKFAGTPVWKALKQSTPDQYKDLEEQMVGEWKTGGATPQSRATAVGKAPKEVQDYMRYRERRLQAVERPARAYFGLDAVPETPGPYLPRRTDAEARESVYLGGGKMGTGRGPQTTVKGHQQERVFETMKEGEAAGTQYEDPRNAILLREWESYKLQATHDLWKRLEGKVLFRDKAAARAASPTGKPWRVENAPGGEWWVRTEEEGKLLEANLTEPKGGLNTFVHFGNMLVRNPSLFNPLPHITKNMAAKYLLARGPVSSPRLVGDAVEYFRGTNAPLIARFKEAMPFSESGETASSVLAQELQRGPFGEALKKGQHALSLLNKGSSRVIFKWADPAMRYSLWKHYTGQGMSDMEAANHAWEDLIRYGVRSDVTDAWKKWPLNFFVPWRYGTFSALVKQVTNHPVRTALVVGGIDYLREMRYRETGRHTHLPWDYVEKPIAVAIQERDPYAIGAITATTAMFGPGGEYGARQLADLLNTASGRASTREWQGIKGMFWGFAQMYDLVPQYKKFEETGDVSHLANMLTTIALGEHSALNYQPGRLGKMLPEWLPGMKKSPRVEAAEAEQQRRREMAKRREAHRRPRRTVEDVISGRGL